MTVFAHRDASARTSAKTGPQHENPHDSSRCHARASITIGHAQPPANLLLVNAKIATVDDVFSNQQAIAMPSIRPVTTLLGGQGFCGSL